MKPFSVIQRTFCDIILGKKTNFGKQFSPIISGYLKNETVAFTSVFSIHVVTYLTKNFSTDHVRSHET